MWLEFILWWPQLLKLTLWQHGLKLCGCLTEWSTHLTEGLFAWLSSGSNENCSCQGLPRVTRTNDNPIMLGQYLSVYCVMILWDSVWFWLWVLHDLLFLSLTTIFIFLSYFGGVVTVFKLVTIVECFMSLVSGILCHKNNCNVGISRSEPAHTNQVHDMYVCRQQ